MRPIVRSSSMDRMVTAYQSREVMRAVVDSYPESGVIVGLSMERGWGDILNVAITTKADQVTGLFPDTHMRGTMRLAVEAALVGVPRIAVQFHDG